MDIAARSIAYSPAGDAGASSDARRARVSKPGCCGKCLGDLRTRPRWNSVAKNAFRDKMAGAKKRGQMPMR